MTSSLLRAQHSPRRWTVIAALVVAAVAHVPVIGTHLEEAPYMGVLFVVLTAACGLLALALLAFDGAAVYALAALTGVLAVAGYAATRTFSFPMLADDVGNWLEPLGVVSVLSESVAAAVAVTVLLPARSAWRAAGSAALPVG